MIGAGIAEVFVDAGARLLTSAFAPIPLRPPAASTIAEGVDRLHFALTGITLFFTVIIFSTIFFFMIKYRRQSEDEIPPEIEKNVPLEILWTGIPTLICVVIFFWSASLYIRNARPPDASTEIFVVGKQWMWHLQHPEGVREINELHVPLGVPIKLTMTGEKGCFARPIHIPLVSSDENGNVSCFLRPILRCRPRADDRLGVCDGAFRLCCVAFGRRIARIDGAGG
jgi:amino acid transporter